MRNFHAMGMAATRTRRADGQSTIVAGSLAPKSRAAIATAIAIASLLTSSIAVGDPPASIVMPGFPVEMPLTAGTFGNGPHVGMSVANLDGDASLEIAISSITNGPMFVFNSDGTRAVGWPSASEPRGFSYFAIADVMPESPGSEVFGGHWAVESNIALLGSGGQLLPGWPIRVANFSSYAPAIFDVNRDGILEMFIEEEDGLLHAYSPSGHSLTGWPAPDDIHNLCGSQRTFTPTFVDLDRDGVLDVLFANGGGGGSQPGACLNAFTIQGLQVPGFPFRLSGNALPQTVLNVADVDGDAVDDIVMIQADANGDLYGPGTVRILGLDGRPKHNMPLASSHTFSGATALGDLDGDGIPEIVAITHDTASAFNGQGQMLPGWPVYYNAGPNGRRADITGCSVAIGDVDGDLQPDIAFCARINGSEAYLFVLNRFGQAIANSPILIAQGASPRGPVIADIDADGHNEIAIAVDASSGTSRMWLLALDKSKPHGRVEWQQFASDAANTGRYGPSFPAVATGANLSLTATQSVQITTGSTTPLEFIVENLGNAPANAIFSVSLPPQAQGRANIPAGCSAFESEITCSLDGMRGAERRIIRLPICTDTIGMYQISATLRGSGPENNYSDNRTSVQVAATGSSGSTCITRQVPGARPTVSWSGPDRLFTQTSYELSWSAFNVTSCTIRTPYFETVGSPSLEVARYVAGTSASIEHFQLECSGPYGNISSGFDIQVVAPQLTLSSSAASAIVGSTITVTWNSQDFDYCEASRAWSGTLATAGARQFTVALGVSEYSIQCTGRLGLASRTITVEGTTASANRSGGGGVIGLTFLLVLSLCAGLRDRQCRSSAVH